MSCRDEIADLETTLHKELEPARPQIKIAMPVSTTFGGKTIRWDEIVNAALEHLVSRDDIQPF